MKMIHEISIGNTLAYLVSNAELGERIRAEWPQAVTTSERFRVFETFQEWREFCLDQLRESGKKKLLAEEIEALGLK
jgi:3-methyladenine DNA glycosylase/8-oxoguanine DNA glycosylase